VMSPLVWVLAVLVVVCRLLGAVCLNGWWRCTEMGSKEVGRVGERSERGCKGSIMSLNARWYVRSRYLQKNRKKQNTYDERTCCEKEKKKSSSSRIGAAAAVVTAAACLPPLVLQQLVLVVPPLPLGDVARSWGRKGT
jgi:hypothetical protein